MRPHHLVVFWWRLPILILHMHVLLMLHLLLRVLLLLLHLHHLYLLRGHLTPHVGVGTPRTAHGSHPVVGSHFHLVGSHHLHLLHALVLHHLHLLLLAHDTRGRHLSKRKQKRVKINIVCQLGTDHKIFLVGGGHLFSEIMRKRNCDPPLITA